MQGKKPVIGRKLARCNVRRTSSIYVIFRWMKQKTMKRKKVLMKLRCTALPVDMKFILGLPSDTWISVLIKMKPSPLLDPSTKPGNFRRILFP